MFEVDDATATAAKVEIDKAIIAYYAVVSPDVYLDAWVLVSHKLSAEWEQEGTSAVGVLPRTGQSFVVTRGLLDVALESERNDV
jgi:hypothetical protein